MSLFIAPESALSHSAHPDRRDPDASERPAPASERRHTGEPSAAASASARAFLVRYTRTLAALLIGIAALLLGWDLTSGTEQVSGHQWLTAIAATTGWVLAVGVWLCRRGWTGGTVHVVTWATPALLLLPLAWLGWLSPDGLILWAPVSTLFAVAFAMAADLNLSGQP